LHVSDTPFNFFGGQPAASFAPRQAFVETSQEVVKETMVPSTMSVPSEDSIPKSEHQMRQVDNVDNAELISINKAQGCKT
jgi:hypothetical protein